MKARHEEELYKLMEKLDRAVESVKYNYIN